MYNYFATWLLWIAEHPWMEAFMAKRDAVVDWIDEMPISERIRDWCINTTNKIVDALSCATQALLWLIWEITKGLLWAGIRLSVLSVCGLICYLMVMSYWDSYPAPITHPSGNVILSRDRCFIKGIEYAEYVAWCRRHRPRHQSVIEIINVTNW